MRCTAQLHPTFGSRRCGALLDTNGGCVNDGNHTDYRPVPGTQGEARRTELDRGVIPKGSLR